jgi:hypothetical protein
MLRACRACASARHARSSGGRLNQVAKCPLNMIETPGWVTVRAHSEQVVGGVGPEKSVSQLIWEIFPIDVREALQQTFVRPARTPSIRRYGEVRRKPLYR